MTADAFPPWVGVFSASAVNQSSDCPESANGIGDRMTQRPKIYLDFYRGLKKAFDRVPLPLRPEFGIQNRPAGTSPSAFYRKRRAARLKAAKALLSATGS